MEKLDRITVNPEICLGQPTIRGMGITVSVILKMLASGKKIIQNWKKRTSGKQLDMQPG